MEKIQVMMSCWSNEAYTYVGATGDKPHDKTQNRKSAMNVWTDVTEAIPDTEEN